MNVFLKNMVFGNYFEKMKIGHFKNVQKCKILQRVEIRKHTL